MYAQVGGDDVLELSVGKKGMYASIQEAIDAVPYAVKARITIEKGVYHEKLFSDKHDVTLEGESGTVVSYGDGAKEILSDGRKRGTFRSYTAFFSGERLSLRNIAFENTAGNGSVAGQAVALYLDVREARLDRVTLCGWQDTLFLAPLPEKEREPGGFFGPRTFVRRKASRVIVTDSVVKGDIDFIFGGADALFLRCVVVSRGPGFVAAPSGKRSRCGFVFADCDFTHEGTIVDNSVYLMRPWRPEGKISCIRCHYGSHINSRGCSPWRGREDEKRFSFAEYACHGDGPIQREYPAKGLSEEEARTLIESFDAS